MRNIFLEKSYPNCGGETSPRPFSGKLNWAYLWIYSLKWYTVCFYRMASWGLSKYIETKLRTTCFHLILSFFETVSLPHFPYNFWKKYFLCYVLLIDKISLSGCLYCVRYWTICVLQLFVEQVVTSWILNLTLSF